MKLRYIILIGIGALGFLGLAMVAGLVLLFAHLSEDVQGVTVAVNGPMDVVVGQTFDLEVVVKNERAGETFQLTDIDLADEYVTGFTVSSTRPKAKSTAQVPITNALSFTFDAAVPPGATQTFVFTLRAEKPGIFRGDLDVTEGLKTITNMAQTVVKEKAIKEKAEE